MLPYVVALALATFASGAWCAAEATVGRRRHRPAVGGGAIFLALMAVGAAASARIAMLLGLSTLIEEVGGRTYSLPRRGIRPSDYSGGSGMATNGATR